MSKKYNVVIIGAGPAGLECVYNLGNSKLSVLIIERNQVIGTKICAGGLSSKDLNWIPKELLDISFKKVFFHYRDSCFEITHDSDLIATVDRKNLGQYQLGQLKQFKNIEILKGVSVRKILSDNSLELSGGKIINFDFMVGADGALSEVRKYLKLSSRKSSIAIQYIIPKRFNKLEIFFDNKLWGTGYLWIFPHKNYDSIGCGSDSGCFTAKKLKTNFDQWLKEHKIDFSRGRFESALINSDYQGYKFNNIFLAGDAAGLTSSITREGIYSAILSGRQIASDILGINKGKNLISEYLVNKRRQEKYLFLFKSQSFLKHLIFFLIFKFNNKQIRNKLKNIFIN